ncbi:MAG TPA: M64 family metallopeptidase [Sunxiuqinia sp.]|nr:M64 family metallopeptidase [Sunxiuqinia sp.]
MIRKWRLISLLMLVLPQLVIAQVNFSDYFKNNTLRIDYLLNGTDSTAGVIVKQMKQEPYYGGSHTNLVDPYNMGTYRYQVFDQKTGTLLFSQGFCPLFQEWQTTEEAKTQKGSFYQVAILPFPKKDIRFVIDQRNWDGKFEPIFSININSENYFIRNEAVSKHKVIKLEDNGKPANKVDVVFLPEGYTAGEMGKFLDDTKRLCKALFDVNPFKKHKKDFNLYAVEVPSQESGSDVPGEHIYKNTAFNSTFYTFDTPRYLTSQDMKSIHDAAADVPYDQVYLLVNTDRYGGGGFYNFICVSSVDNELSDNVFIHEFGHSFAGLADEYYTSDVAYSDYYNLTVEPWEPNITTLVDFKSKWADLVAKDTPIPTPRIPKYSKVVGVFEGGGYVDKGIYSPMEDCRMKSNVPDAFCPVCQRAIERAIEWDCK